MSDDEDPVTKRPVDERDIFGDSDSELSSVVDSDEEREPSSDEADNDKTGDYQKKTVTGLKLKLKVPTASGDASSPTKPKKKKKPSKDKDNAEADGEEDGEKKKKKKKKKEKEKRSEAGVEVVEDEETRKKREVEMDFKNAMAVFKPKRANRKKDDEDSTRWDEEVERLKTQMLEKAEADNENRKRNMPSLAKLSMLSKAMQMLSRTDKQDVMLENDVLTAIKAWLEPSEVDGSLPPLDVQKAMLSVLEKYEVDADFVERLRTSQIGVVVQFFTKDEEVLPDVRKRCQALVDKWTKFMIDKYSKQPDKPWLRSPAKRMAAGGGNEDKDEDGAEYRYARIPKPMTGDFRVRPKSEYSASEARKSGKADEPSRFKKIATVLQSSRSGVRAPPKIIQG